MRENFDAMFSEIADRILDRVYAKGIPHPEEYREYLINVLWSIQGDTGMTADTFEVDEEALADEIAEAYWED